MGRERRVDDPQVHIFETLGFLVEQVSKIEKDLTELKSFMGFKSTFDDKDETSFEEKIYYKIVNLVAQYFYIKTSHELGSKGLETANETIRKLQELFDKSGIVSLYLDSKSKRAFIYALHPMEFIKDNDLWEYLQAWIKSIEGYTLAIGQFKMDSKLDLGKSVFEQTNKTIKCLHETKYNEGLKVDE
ncbi:MAG: hypothetical protein IKK93_01040 [Campylobacter sp.]|nr:hypothetical protein [Campylobacter sp.]